ncbi:hypothetical protein GCM10009801_82020 [Streptomyces albiaxialis]|uniref:Uncharacterized protein n=1 Tax=Streptomyces albiaxialis TaxID=329523 RepID=A0ABN2X8M5_9ACTN
MNHQQSSARQAEYVAACRDQLHQARRRMSEGLLRVGHAARSALLPTDVAPLAAHVLGLTSDATAVTAPAMDLAVVLVQTEPHQVDALSGRAVGLCWRCEKHREVEWVGPVPVGIDRPPMYMCEPCRTRWVELAHWTLRTRDSAHL